MELDEYTSAAEASRLLGYADKDNGSSVRRLAKAGGVPGALKVGRDWLIPKIWIKDFSEHKKNYKGPGRPFSKG